MYWLKYGKRIQQEDDGAQGGGAGSGAADGGSNIIDLTADSIVRIGDKEVPFSSFAEKPTIPETYDIQGVYKASGQDYDETNAHVIFNTAAINKAASQAGMTQAQLETYEQVYGAERLEETKKSDAALEAKYQEDLKTSGIVVEHLQNQVGTLIGADKLNFGDMPVEELKVVKAMADKLAGTNNLPAPGQDPTPATQQSYIQHKGEKYYYNPNDAESIKKLANTKVEVDGAMRLLSQLRSTEIARIYSEANQQT